MSALTRDRMVAQMASYRDEGIHESPAHSNQTRLGAKYGWNGVAWCAITICCAIYDVAARWIIKSAGVAQLIGWAQAGKFGLRWIPREQAASVRHGMASTFDWGRLSAPGNANNFHISDVIDPGTLPTQGLGGRFHTIGGNENDAVTDQWRDCTYVQGWIDFPWESDPTPTAPPSIPTVSDHLGVNGVLGRGQHLVSNNGRYRLEMQGDGNLVLYNAAGRPVWSSRTDRKPVDRLVMQGDGNVVLYGAAKAYWSSKTDRSGATVLYVQDDGNVVVYAGRRAVWSTGTVGR